MSSSPEFTDLPASIVEEMIAHASRAGDLIAASLNAQHGRREALRAELERQGLVARDSSLGFPPFPTACGVDGSFALERLLSVDLAASVALAVEGFEPPGVSNPWNGPRHELFTAPEPHDMETPSLLRALMIGTEVLLASSAPHEVVLLDMTLTLPAVFLDEGVRKAAGRTRLRSSLELLSKLESILDGYVSVLRAERTDRQYAGLPKYSSRREVGRRLSGSRNQDDRSLLTSVLAPGELTVPIPLEEPLFEGFSKEIRENAGLGRIAAGREEALLRLIREIRVFYYRPHEWLPALRVEVPGAVANNPGRLALVLQSLKHQSSTSVMLEPYPLYMADRMARTVSRSLPAFRQIALREVSSKYSGDTGDLFFSLHGYRSEGGQ